MAKGKTVAAVWICEETGAINGAFRIMKEKIKGSYKNEILPKTSSKNKAQS